MSRTAPGFSIAVPGDWIVVSPEMASDTAAIEMLLDRQGDTDSITGVARDSAVRMIQRLAIDAVDAGVRFAAVLIAGDQVGPVVASLTVASIWLDKTGERAAQASRSDAPGGRWLDADDEPGTHESASPSGDLPPGPVRELSPAKVDQVALEAGPALRIERSLLHCVGDSLEQEVMSLEYVIEVGDSGAALVLTGTSPAVRRHAELSRMFGEIAESLRLGERR